MMKRCSQCAQLKDESAFWRTRRAGQTDKVRLRARCIECCQRDQRDHSADPKPTGKVCTSCEIWKPLADFHKHKICRYGVESICKRCKFEKRKERDAADPTRVRRMDLKANYGLTLDDYGAMHARQGGRSVGRRA